MEYGGVGIVIFESFLNLVFFGRGFGCFGVWCELGFGWVVVFWGLGEVD